MSQTLPAPDLPWPTASVRTEQTHERCDTPTLAEQQRWLLERVLLGPQANSRLVEERIQGSAALSAAQRLAIYQEGYRLRLLECLQAEFPALHVCLGESLFRLFAIGYLEQQPSRHYSLYQLGEGFADFLSRTRPAGSGLPADTAAQLLLPEQLARLERAQASALRAMGTEQREADTGRPDHWLSWPVLALPDTSQLVEVNFDLLDYLQQTDRYLLAQQQGEQQDKPPLPAVTSQSLLVYRHQYRVNVVRLEPWQATMVRQLQQGQPCDWSRFAAALGLAESELLSRLHLWLARAAAQSMVVVPS
ncbi:hypothetical protein C4K68_28410 [Pokkaliibacter plantistimulans]|uniref:Putative DNA-binding domain-containing protein n=1 Tax=Proteobacteria bacterium 228 TaxID=2083153 RepID=A0A2S5KGV0_9PROT|nr:DNA-binding domain-containing protein [Pokkaliibacter plantistimulans]PPC74037.1 hypothetical protein C4K68_28410 [Pokkaliibacter plantistimulans]